MDMFDIGATIRTKKDLNEDQMHNMPREMRRTEIHGKRCGEHIYEGLKKN